MSPHYQKWGWKRTEGDDSWLTGLTQRRARCAKTSLWRSMGCLAVSFLQLLCGCEKDTKHSLDTFMWRGRASSLQMPGFTWEKFLWFSSLHACPVPQLADCAAKWRTGTFKNAYIKVAEHLVRMADSGIIKWIIHARKIDGFAAEAFNELVTLRKSETDKVEGKSGIKNKSCHTEDTWTRTPSKRGQCQSLKAPVATSMHLEKSIKCHSSRKVFKWAAMHAHTHYFGGDCVKMSLWRPCLPYLRCCKNFGHKVPMGTTVDIKPRIFAFWMINGTWTLEKVYFLCLSGVCTFLWLSPSDRWPHPSWQCSPLASEPPVRRRMSPSSCKEQVKFLLCFALVIVSFKGWCETSFLYRFPAYKRMTYLNWLNQNSHEK